MTDAQPQPRLVRFGAFEVDLRTGELRKDGTKLKFSGQPFQVLAILLEHAGDVVTREELQKHLWPDTFVDAERNLNTAINKIREALGDSAENPRFVETLPRRGYRFIGQMERDLPVTDEPVETFPPEEPTRDKPRSGGKPFLVVVPILCALILALGVAAILWIAGRPQAKPKVVQFRKLTSDGQRKHGLVVSDGVRIYFNEELPDGRNIVAQVSIEGGEAIPMALGISEPSVLDLSKDRTELLVTGFKPEEGSSLWVQPVAGGSPHRVGAIRSEAASFGADGTTIVYSLSRGHDVYAAARDGSSPRKLFSVEHEPNHFRFSPDARVLRFSQHDFNSDSDVVMGATVEGAELHRIIDGCCGSWTPDGRFFIFVRRTYGQSDIWVLRETNESHGRRDRVEPIRVTSGPLEFLTSEASEDGKEIFAIAQSRRAEVIRYDSRSHDFVPYLSGISAVDLAFSPDKQWVAYTSYPEGILWRSRVDGSERLQLTVAPMKVAMPRWSPDGKQIAFHAVLPGTPWNIYVIPSSGGSADHLLPSEQSQLDADWSPDGKSLIFGSAADPRRAIYILDMASRRVTTLPESEGYFSPHWSPDGRHISATISSSQQLMLFDVAAHKWTKPCDCHVGYPVWSPDAKYLYFQLYPNPSKSYRIVRLRITDGKIEDVAGISNVGRFTVGTWGQWFGLAPDGSPLLARDISTEEIYALEMEWP